jgi:hypothetical protein
MRKGKAEAMEMVIQLMHTKTNNTGYKVDLMTYRNKKLNFDIFST